MCDEFTPISPLDVVEALVGREPGYARVVARLRRLQDECDARVDGTGRAGDVVRDAFDQIGGLVAIALERLEEQKNRRTDEFR